MRLARIWAAGVVAVVAALVASKCGAEAPTTQPGKPSTTRPAKPPTTKAARPPATRPAPKPKADAKEIAELISQLGAQDFKTREAATGKLIALGEKAVRGPLEARAKEKDLDPEVASRIEQILEKFDPKEGRTVTDRASGVTVSIAGGGTTVTGKDTATGKALWQTKLPGNQKATNLKLAGAQVQVEPAGWLIDLKTGRLTSQGGIFIRNGGVIIRAGGAVQGGGAVIKLQVQGGQVEVKKVEPGKQADGAAKRD